MSDTRHAPGDALVFGQAAVSRDEGMSSTALGDCPYTVKDPEDKYYTTQLVHVGDAREDARFKDRPFVKAGVVMIIAVQLKSRSGYAIGSFTLIDEVPRPSLDYEEVRFLEDMSTTIIEHLEHTRGRNARDRGEKMVRSLGSFVEGLSSTRGEDEIDKGNDQSEDLSDNSRPIPETRDEDIRSILSNVLHIHSLDPSNTTNDSEIHQTVDERIADQTTLRGQHSNNPDWVSGKEIQERFADKTEQDMKELKKKAEQPKSAEDALNHTLDAAQNTFLPPGSGRTFGRAANLLRQALGADGVIFFNASFNSSPHEIQRRDHSSRRLKREMSSETSSANESSSDTSPGSSFSARLVRRKHSERSARLERQSSSEHSTQNAASPGARRDRSREYCDILGSSLSMYCLQTPDMPREKLRLSPRDMRKCIRRYTNGKVFSFTETGDFSLGEDNSSASSRGLSGESELPPDEEAEREPMYSRKERNIRAKLITCIPAARTVIFLPLYNYGLEKWATGVFIWTTRLDRLLNANVDLNYIKAFSNSAMGEIARLDAVAAERTKSNFVASISHELRSPLHGIMGNIEFLQDTAIDTFQASMISSIETCGRTLLDTVNHVLDYAKINDFSRRHPNKSQKALALGRQAGDGNTMPAMSLVDELDLALTVEEAVETAFAGHSFKTTKRGANLHDSTPSNQLASPGMTSPRPHGTLVEEYFPEAAGKATTVRLVLDIEYQENWMVTTQPGAIRRLIVNLLGNALKYTSKGFIEVELKSHERDKGPADHRKVSLRVKDSGKGMSNDFLQNKVFSAFSQEDPLSVGTGLGLNIVAQIVKSLGGVVDLKSKKDVGTDVKVWLNLPIVEPDHAVRKEPSIMKQVQSETNGKLVLALNPDWSENGKMKVPEDKGKLLESVENLCHHWFGMQLGFADRMHDKGADMYLYAEPPPIEHLFKTHGERAAHGEIPLIIMCSNQLEAAALRAGGLHKLVDAGRIVEVTSQPCGPEKLATVLSRCLARSKEKVAVENQGRSTRSNQDEGDLSQTPPQ